MRELQFGEQVVRVRATPLALLFYKQEFGSDLLGDLIKLEQVAKDPSKLDSIAILQLVWAMAKADAGLTAKFPSFEMWVSELEVFDLTDQETINAIMQEAMDGFFRSRATGVAPARSGRRK